MKHEKIDFPPEVTSYSRAFFQAKGREGGFKKNAKMTRLQRVRAAKKAIRARWAKRRAVEMAKALKIVLDT